VDGIIRCYVTIIWTAHLTRVAKARQLVRERLVARSDGAFAPVLCALPFDGTPFLVATVVCISVVDTHLCRQLRYDVL
jgi:hypothetical protein